MRWKIAIASVGIVAVCSLLGVMAISYLAFGSMAEGLLVEAHESDLAVASEVTQARVREALRVGAETYEGELEMDYLSRLSPTT
jgi:hypothetical protein